jgi:PPM family protein phosphatase
MAGSIHLAATVLTHPGAVRPRNEDTIGVADRVMSGAMAEPVTLMREIDAPVVCVVADGLGGHTAGEVASRHAVERLLERAAQAADAGAVEALLREIHAELFDLMRARPEVSGMGTTVAGVSVARSSLIVFNVGDSRVYRIEDGSLLQLSTDDTPGPKLADGRTAMVTTSQITQCLGGYDEMGLVPHALAEPMIGHRRYLICSDGLSDLLAREAIEARLQADDRATVKALFEAAMDLGGRDNISIILLDLSAQ